MERIGKQPRLITLAVVFVVIAVLYVAKGVLIPFALAMLVSFLLAPLVVQLQRWHCNRVVAVVAAVLLVFMVCIATSWFLVVQVQDVTANLSVYRDNIRDRADSLRGLVAEPMRKATTIAKDLGVDPAPALTPDAATGPIQTVRIAEPARGDFSVFLDAVRSSIELMLTAAMVLLFAFVMLLRRDDLGDRFIHMVGQGKILVTTRALKEASQRVSNYLWRLLLLNGLHGLAIGIGLTYLGVPNALLWGALAGVLRFIPYVGPWVAATFPVLNSLAVSPGWTQPLLVIGWIALLELISNNLFEPWFFGSRMGISPLAILVSALFWTWLWGPVGLVLSTPLTVCLVVMGKYVPQLQFLQLLIGDSPGLSPPGRLYQRLIAGDQDQAWLVLRTEMDQKALLELYDAVVMPALSMAEFDRQQGAFGDAAEERIEETMKLLLEEAGEHCEVSVAGTVSAVAPAPPEPLRVLCLPARGMVDALAATMLRQVLERDGVQGQVSSTAELSGETLALLESRRVDIVCISVVPPTQFMHVRYLCKRIVSRFPNLPIIVGIWTSESKKQELEDRFATMTGVHVVASLDKARAKVRELGGPVRIQRETRTPVGSLNPAPTG